MKILIGLFLIGIINILSAQETKSYFTRHSFYSHQKERDIHQHLISLDTVSGVVYLEYVKINKNRRRVRQHLASIFSKQKLPKRAECSPCKKLFFVNETLQNTSYIDTLGVVQKYGFTPTLTPKDTFCVLLRDWNNFVSHQKTPNARIIDSIRKVILTEYDQDAYTGSQIADLGLIKQDSILRNKYLFKNKKKHFVIAYNVQIIGACHWNIETVDRNMNSPLNYESDAHKMLSDYCWYGNRFPPRDFIQPWGYDLVSPLTNNQILNLKLKKCSEIFAIDPYERVK